MLALLCQMTVMLLSKALTCAPSLWHMLCLTVFPQWSLVGRGVGLIWSEMRHLVAMNVAYNSFKNTIQHVTKKTHLANKGS